MDPVTASQKVNIAIRRAKDLSASAKAHPLLDRHREPEYVYTPYEFRGTHVKRVIADPERELANKVRNAIAASRADIYERLRSQFASDDDCGCES
jgi:hypothetical protein